MELERNNDISEKIAAYLQGRMDPAEAEAFKKAVKQDPLLEDQVAFAMLIKAGLEELATREAGKKAGKRRTKTILLLLGLILLGLGLYFFLKDKKIEEPEPNIGQRVTQPLTRPDHPVIEQGGGFSGSVSDRVNAISWNANGDVLLTGMVKGPAYFGNIKLPPIGETDLFLASYSIETGYNWVRGFGSKAGVSTAEDIAIDESGQIIITGAMFDQTTFDGRTFRTVGNSNLGKMDFFLAKFDPAGNLLWLDHGGGNVVPNLQTGDNRGRAVATTIQGDIIAVGDYIGAANFGSLKLPEGGPNEDTYLAKYASDGEVLWAKAITGNFMVSAYDVATNPEGDIFVIGYFGHHNIGGHVIFDEVQLESSGGRDIFVAKYDSEGKLLWARRAGASGTGPSGGYDYATHVAPDNQGGCLVTGWFQGEAQFGTFKLTSSGGRDIFLAKYSETGEVLWAVRAGGPLNDQGAAVVIDQQQNHYCTGFFRGKAFFGTNEIHSTGESDIFVAKYDRNGALLWLRQMGGDGEAFNSDSATGMAINPNGQIVLSGFFSGNMKIGNRILKSQGKEDFFLVFFDEQGNLLQFNQFEL
ncbi:MAG: hypothetical protein D6714_13395 [Bacteroidetes bacterium]|nr:MAG: hypothetical protein D6714_13395 [Bacteroidota bacterium]